VSRRDTFRLPRHPASLGFARQQVRRHLAIWGYRADSEITEDIVQVVSELAANVVRHGPILQREFEVAVTALADGSCFVEVSDETADAPVLRAVPDDEKENGRGLLLVDALAQAWGVWQHGRYGKTVWALILARPR
jgi:anti-sigma regulatory factor (Ser/Thr protein kinase)